MKLFGIELFGRGEKETIFTGTLYHESNDPDRVVENGFDPSFSSGHGDMFLTDQPQPNSNIAVPANNLHLYQSSHIYGKGDPPRSDLVKMGYDGKTQPVADGDKYVQVGGTEVIVFDGSLGKLGTPTSYYYGEEDL